MGYTVAEWLGMLGVTPRSVVTEWKASGNPESFLELVVHRLRMDGLDGYGLADMSIMLEVPEHVLALWFYKDGGGVSMYDALECHDMLDKWDMVSHFDKGREVVVSKEFVLLTCNRCEQKLLLPVELASTFRHGPMCEQYLWEDPTT